MTNRQDEININSIKQFREDINMSEQQLAEAIGVSISTLSLYESGIRMPSLEKRLKLSEVLGLPSTYFLNGKKPCEVKQEEMNGILHAIHSNFNKS